jgi:hypothetical protein
MTLAAYIMWRFLNVTRFHKLHQATLSREDVLRGMEAGAPA